METIKEAKDFLRASYVRGATCPCCGLFVKLYKRKMGSVMARCLIRLSHLDGYVHVREIVQGISDTGTNDFSKLLYWGLIEELPNKDAKKKTSGYWRITPKGRDFVNRRIMVPRHVFVFNAVALKFSDETTSIIDALGAKFDYHELMRGVPAKV